MAKELDFYFDFSSPYGYLASKRIDAIAREFGRIVRWRPILLGVVFKVTGQTPLVSQKLRGPYHERDLARTARRLGIPFRLPEPFPFAATHASRGFYWLQESDNDQAVQFAHAVFDRAFVEGKIVQSAEDVTEVGATIGVDRDRLAQAIARPDIKDKLRQEVDRAIERGVFGSPFIFADEEPFWGNDRLEDVREWLRRGGW